jgi:hypothetical protein
MLASFAKQAPTSVWHDAPPDFLSQALLDDVTIFTIANKIFWMLKKKTTGRTELSETTGLSLQSANTGSNSNTTCQSQPSP